MITSENQDKLRKITYLPYFVAISIALLVAARLAYISYFYPVTTVSCQNESTIALVMKRDANYHIYLMSLDDVSFRALTTGGILGASQYNYSPAWSPDGKKIAFVSERESHFGQIFVMNADGSQQVNLTPQLRSANSPSWSPDGQRIALVTVGDGGSSINVMNSDGSNRHKITDVGSNIDPAWSPAGDKIAFASERNGYEQLLLMDVDGSNIVQLTNDQSDNLDAAWSPDGKQIAFIRYQDGNWDIYTLSVDDLTIHQLTNDHADDLHPDWSPDGKKIVFMSLRDGQEEIYVMANDGSDQTRITREMGYVGNPVWRPNAGCD